MKRSKARDTLFLGDRIGGSYMLIATQQEDWPAWVSAVYALSVVGMLASVCWGFPAYARAMNAAGACPDRRSFSEAISRHTDRRRLLGLRDNRLGESQHTQRGDRKSTHGKHLRRCHRAGCCNGRRAAASVRSALNEAGTEHKSVLPQLSY